MCRLALINNRGIKHIDENYGLTDFFDYLENSMGGHGNGVCIIKNDGKYTISKGVKLSNQEIAEDVLCNIDDIKWIIYHTRLASIGTINDRNCHPFESRGMVLAMNGTEHNYMMINNKLTDTENILLSSKDPMIDTRYYRSVFLGYENGKVFANKNNGSLKYIPCKNGGRIFASEFPMEYYYNDTVYEAPQVYVEGQRMKPLKPAYCYEYKNRYISKFDVQDEYYNYYMRGLI